MILHGRNLIIKANGVAIAAAKSCEINVKAKEIPVSSPTDGQWDLAIVGRKSWSVSCGHLVTSIIRNIAMVGTQVTVSMGIEDNSGSPIRSFVDNVTITTPEETITSADWMVWDKTRKLFLAVGRSTRPVMTLYYQDYQWSGSSAYSNPQDGALFYDDNSNEVYVYYDGDLHAERLTGMANVTEWRASGSVGSLSQGSFRFNGTGPLSPSI